MHALCYGAQDDYLKRGECLTCGLGRDIHGSRLLHPEACHIPEEGKGACSLLRQAIVTEDPSRKVPRQADAWGPRTLDTERRCCGLTEEQA